MRRALGNDMCQGVRQRLIASEIGFGASKMGDPKTLEEEVGNTQKPFTKDEALRSLSQRLSEPNPDLIAPTDARIMRGVCARCRRLTQYHAKMPPTARANVNDGTLYIPCSFRLSQFASLWANVHSPTATAMPPGTSGRHRLPIARVLVIVATAKRVPAPIAHCLAMYGSPWPVTSRAVNIQT